MNFRRLTGIAGLLGVVLSGGANALRQSPPATASGEEIIRWVTDRHDTLQWIPYVTFIASFVLVFFGVGIWTAVRPGDRERGEGWTVVGLIGAIGLAITYSLEAAAIAVLAGSGSVLSAQPALAQVLRRLYSTVGEASDPFIAMFMLGMSVAGLRSGGLPAWIGWLGLLGAAATLVSPLRSVGESPALVAATAVQRLSFVIWVLALSVWMLLRKQRPALTVAT